MSLNLGSTQIIIRKTVDGIPKDITCSEVVSDRLNKRKFIGTIPEDFHSGELQDVPDSNVETDVIIKIGDVELSSNELGSNLDVPDIPPVIVDNEPPVIDVSFVAIEGQSVQLKFNYIADNHIVVDEVADTEVEAERFEIGSNGVKKGKFKFGNSSRKLPGFAGNTQRVPGKNVSFVAIAIPFTDGKMYRRYNSVDETYADEITQTTINADKKGLRDFIKELLKVKNDGNRLINGVHNPNYIPIAEFEIAANDDDNGQPGLRNKASESPFITADASTGEYIVELSSSADLIDGYTGEYKLYAVASDHINNHSDMTLITGGTGNNDGVIRLLDIEPPVVNLTSAESENQGGSPVIKTNGFVYDEITNIDAYLLVTDINFGSLLTYSTREAYKTAYQSLNSGDNGVTQAQNLKDLMITHGTQLASNVAYINSNVGSFSQTLTTYYKSATEITQHINTSDKYYVYLMAKEVAEGVGSEESVYQNHVFNKSGLVSFTQQIEQNTVTVNSSNTTSHQLVLKDDIVTFNWNMKFTDGDTSNFDLTLYDGSKYTIPVTNITKIDSLTYNATYTLSLIHI